MNSHPLGQSKDPLFRDALAAMRRAAQAARRIARQTGTRIVIVRDGKIIHIDPTTGAEVARRVGK